MELETKYRSTSNSSDIALMSSICRSTSSSMNARYRVEYEPTILGPKSSNVAGLWALLFPNSQGIISIKCPKSIVDVSGAIRAATGTL